MLVHGCLVRQDLLLTLLLTLHYIYGYYYFTYTTEKPYHGTRECAYTGCMVLYEINFNCSPISIASWCMACG